MNSKEFSPTSSYRMSNMIRTTDDIDPALFVPATADHGLAEKISRPTLTYMQDAILRLKKDKLAIICFLFICAIVTIGIAGPWFFPAEENGVSYENVQNLSAIDQPPSWKGEKVLVIPDEDPPFEDKIQADWPENIVPKKIAELTPPAELKILEKPTVNGIELVWTAIPGVAGYQIFRTTIDSQTFQESELVSDSIARGVLVGEISDPQQFSFVDRSGLDTTYEYAYSIVSYIEDPTTGEKEVSPTATILRTKLEKTLKLSDAQTLDANVEVGQTIQSRTYFFGTDALGRDVLARMVKGTRVDLMLALLVPALSLLVGLIVGAFSGLIGGKLDTFLMRTVEVIENFPDLLFFIILQVALGKGFFSLFIAMTAFSWAGFARIVRGEVLRLREIEFVQAAKLLGASTMRVVLRHVAPNLVGIIIIAWSARIPAVIAFETFLSMLGLGLEQPDPSWGNVVFDVARRLQVNPLQFFLPASVLGFTLLAFYLLGNSLRDAFDPNLRGRS